MLELKALDNFKKIKLTTAQRYLRRYTGNRIDCLDAMGIKTVSRLCCTSGIVEPSFCPKKGDRVFLRRAGDRIAEITDGLPTNRGYFVPGTGEFTEAFSYTRPTPKKR